MDKYGLIGRNLSHSFSQKYFRQKFIDQHIKADYLNFELNDISTIVDLFKDSELKGLNVTVPYKLEVIKYLDGLSVETKKIGAVNTIKKESGKWIGYNTDAYGFRQMIKPFFKSIHEKALILGTGGAAKSVQFVLNELGVDFINISRNPSGTDQFGYDDINENMVCFHKLIINTTPVGMFPDIDKFPNIPFHAIDSQHLVIDMIYNPKETIFLQKAALQGATILNGETMLIQQAEKAWEIWNS